jgi:Uma2 family endonuclease
MQEWVANGCRLAWLIDPVEQKAYVYTPQGLAKTIESFAGKLSGEDVLPGFELDLSLLK